MSCLPGAQLSKAPQGHERRVGNGPASPCPLLLSPWVPLDVSWGIWNIVGMVR